MKIYGFLFFILLHFHSTAQINVVDKLHALQQNPTLKEKVYIHTNKTSYFTDDTIWFKAYVSDTINFPSIETTKLYVNLLDDQGTPIYSKNIFINDGTGSGEFELNDAVMPGKYYIQAYTNFMRNFGDDYHYLQEVLVVGENPARSTAIGKTNYDVQLFPEGGHLLEGIQNTIGIKALVNGKGIDFSGNIVNDMGESITRFKDQHLGMAKFQFVYETGKTYTANISVNDTLLKIKVPKALEKGVSLQVDNSDQNYLEVTIKTNEATFLHQNNPNYTLLYHQDHRIFDLISINRMDSLSGSIKTKKDVFLDGVNTVTLFKDDKPIAERKFFVEKEHKRTNVTIEEVGLENDSLEYKILVQNRNRPLKGEISLIVLPVNSEALEEKQNIRTAFLLTPFLKGHIENPAYYFNLDNPNRKEYLDLLLLTQRWAKYSLSEMIAELNPKQKFEFEYGFKLKGKLKSLGKHNNLAFIADDYRVVDTVSLDNKLEFVFNDLLIYKGDTTKVAYLNLKGKIIKPEGVSYDSIVEKNLPIAKIPFEEKFSIDSETSRTEQSTSIVTSNPNSDSSTITNDTTIISEKGIIALDEVILTERKRSERYLQRRKLIEKYKPIVFDIGRYYDIPTETLFIKYDYDLFSYLESKEGVQLNDRNNANIFLEIPGISEVLVAIDGRMLIPEELRSSPIRMKDVANVMVSNGGILNGQLFSLPIYQVFTTDAYRNNTVELFDEHIITDGYDKSKKYYSPHFDKNKFGVEDWMEVDRKPTQKIDKNGEVIKPEEVSYDSSEEGITALDEVIVTERKRSERYLQRRKLIKKYKPIVSDIGKYYDIPIPEVYNNSNSSLMDLLASQRFLVRTDNNGQYFLGGDSTLGYLFINGRPIQPAELPTLHLQIKDMENFMVNNLGYNFAIGKSISIIQVFTSDALGQNKNEVFDEHIITDGYDKSKKYYSLLYDMNKIDVQDFIEVDWKPTLKTDKNGEVFFKVLKQSKTNGLLFSIQGFSEEGHLISDTIIHE